MQWSLHHFSPDVFRLLSSNKFILISEYKHTQLYSHNDVHQRQCCVISTDIMTQPSFAGIVISTVSGVVKLPMLLVFGLEAY